MAGRKGQRSGGHNAKTTAQHEADGTYQPCRHNNRADVEPAKGAPTMPRGLTQDQKKLWKEVIEYLPPGCVGALDNAALRSLVEMYAIYQNAMRKWKRNVLDKNARFAAKDAFDRFWKIAQDFGMSPVARSRLQIGQPSDGNEESSDSKESHAILLKMRESG